MKAGLRIGGTGVLAIGLLAGQAMVAFAEGQAEGKAERKQQRAEACDKAGKEGKEGKGGCSADREQIREQMKQRMEKHQQARRATMEAMAKEEDPYKALAIFREHAVAQHGERVAMHEEMMEKQLSSAGERFEKNNVPMEKREEILKKMIEGMEKRKAMGEAHYTEMLATLDALAAKEGLTKEDVRNAIKEARPDRPGKRDGEEGKPGKHHRKGRPEGDDAAPQNPEKPAPDA